MYDKIFPFLDKYNFYSWKGQRYRILKQLIEIFKFKPAHKRLKLMEPLVKELQKKHPVDPVSPYRQLPRLEVLKDLSPKDAQGLIDSNSKAE
jgi:hypothetical protein